MIEEILKIDLEKVTLEGNLTLPNLAKGMILFVHGSGSGRFSPRNQFVAKHLNKLGYGTFLFDLFSSQEGEIPEQEFNLKLLAGRLRDVTNKLKTYPFLTKLPFGYYGSSTGAAVALVAASYQPDIVHAVVCRGGRVDLASGFLSLIEAPTLLIAGENDPVILNINRESMELLDTSKELKTIPNASHLFEEPGTLEAVASATSSWFENHLCGKLKPEK